MNYEERFEMREVVNLEVKGYPSGAFKYKPQNGGEETEWIGQYIISDPLTGESKQDIKKLNMLKINQLVETPFTKELIKKIIDLDKEWKSMNMNERWMLMSKLKPTELDNILSSINTIDDEEEEKKKE